jgi:hypothetical protein
MGTVHDIDRARRRRARAPGRELHEDLIFSSEIPEACEGCGARRVFITAIHDTGTDRGTVIGTLTLPHFLCDGSQVVHKEEPEGA